MDVLWVGFWGCLEMIEWCEIAGVMLLRDGLGEGGGGGWRVG